MILAGEPQITIIGSFGSAGEALRGFRRTSPDVILTDLDLPDMPGDEFIQQARAKLPGAMILVHTALHDRDRVLGAFSAGATGYVLKGTSPKALIEALANLHDRGAPMSPKIARMVITEFHKKNNCDPSALSLREKEILSGIDNGLTCQVLARNLRISPRTVRRHVRNIHEKLKTKSKEEVLRKAEKG
jgi:two-component system NarL family response regulator